MKFNEFMKKCREQKSLTQEEAAKAIGVGPTTIQNWERSSTYPERAVTPNIAKVYEVEIKEIFEAMANDFEIEDEEINSDKPKVIPYTDLLPDNLDYSIIEGLEFNKKEQDMFLIFALNVKFGANPVPEILNKYPDSLSLALFIDKLEKYNLFTIKKETLNDKTGYNSRYVTGSISSHFITLTEPGSLIYTLIKSQKYYLFNIYDLDFNDFLSVLDIYEIISNKKSLIDTIKSLTRSEIHYLEEYKKNEDYREYRNVPKEIKVKTYMHDKILNIDSSYSIIELEEPNDEIYQTEKELYLKKLDFYEQNKDLNEGLVAPKPFEFKEVKKATASEKAKKFMIELNGYVKQNGW